MPSVLGVNLPDTRAFEAVRAPDWPTAEILFPVPDPRFRRPDP
ncbi:hypothetical protein QFZ74_001263 [Streptomyces sp. V3I7]|nr:hypothetical protein [Streptomyces sp. V3I7]